MSDDTHHPRRPELTGKEPGSRHLPPMTEASNAPAGWDAPRVTINALDPDIAALVERLETFAEGGRMAGFDPIAEVMQEAVAALRTLARERDEQTKRADHNRIAFAGERLKRRSAEQEVASLRDALTVIASGDGDAQEIARQTLAEHNVTAAGE